MRLTVRAPATAANLGAGFDCLGLALDLENEFVLDTEAEPGLEVIGEGAEELTEPGSNLAAIAIQRAFEAEGEVPPAFQLRCENRIPLRRGLGSSASAVVAGLLLADRRRGRLRAPLELLDEAVGIEGHADNVAACLLGGLTVAYRTHRGWRAERVDPDERLMPTALIPEALTISTVEARRALAAEVSLEDAVFNVSRAALTVVGMTGRPERLADALDDRLHESQRLALVPEAAEVFARLRGDGFPVCVAGSGPTLLAFPRADGAGPPDPGSGWRVLPLTVQRDGARVVSA